MFLAWLLLTIDPIPDIESSVAEQIAAAELPAEGNDFTLPARGPT